MKTTHGMKKINCLIFKPSTDFEHMIISMLNEEYKQGILLEQLLFILIDSDIDNDQDSQQVIHKFAMDNGIKSLSYNKRMKEYYANHTLKITSSSTMEMVLINEGVLQEGVLIHNKYHLIHEKFDMLNDISVCVETNDISNEQADKLLHAVEFIKSLPK